MITSGWCLDEVRLHSVRVEEKQVDIIFSTVGT